MEQGAAGMFKPEKQYYWEKVKTGSRIRYRVWCRLTGPKKVLETLRKHYTSKREALATTVVPFFPAMAWRYDLSEGAVIVQEREVPRENLIPLLLAVLAERNDDQVYLRAGGTLAYAQVAEIMGALNAAGIRRIGLVTEGGGPRLDDGG